MIEADAARPGSSGAGDFFSLAERRLGWLDARQQVLAQNIANANTPDYRPRDLSAFEQVLADRGLGPARTDPGHLGGTLGAARLVQTVPSARGPDGNAVDVEDQLTKVADVETQQALVGNLWKSTMNLYLAALGR